MRIAVLNNYSSVRVKSEVANGLKPSHHLYSADFLEGSGHHVIYIDPDTTRIWYRLGTWLARIPFCNVGDLGIQAEALRRRNEYDIIYAPCQNVTLFLGVLAYFGLFKKKIVALGHHPFLRGRLGRWRRFSLHFAINGHSTFAALSSAVAAEINLIRNLKNSVVLHWGPDVNYYDKVRAARALPETKSSDLISIGRTGRDNTTLIRAFNNADVVVDIYTMREAEVLPEHASNIRIHYLDHEEQLPYPEIIALTLSAKILAIPLVASTSLSGLTSITDGMALAMPMLVTKNSYLDVEIEAAGGGFWIEPGDADGWREKALSILGKPETQLTMGRDARVLADTQFNKHIFTQELMTLLAH